MKVLKQTLSLLVVFMMVFTTVAFAEQISCMDGNTYTVTATASSKELKAGETFTLSVYLTADSGEEEAVLNGGGMIGWNLIYDSAAFEIDATNPVAYGYSLKGNTNDGVIEAGNYATQIDVTDAVTFVGNTAVAVYSFKVVEGAEEKDYTFELESPCFADSDGDGAMGDLDNISVSVDTLTVVAAGPTENVAEFVKDTVELTVEGETHSFTDVPVFEGTTTATSFKLKAVYGEDSKYLNNGEAFNLTNFTNEGGNFTFQVAIIGKPAAITIDKLVIE